MEYLSRIDAIGLFGKVAIENSKMNRDEKEWAKLGVEGLQAVLKSLQSSNTINLSVLGISIEDIRRIKTVARRCLLKRVVLFPCCINGNNYTLFRIYGGDLKSFCDDVGFCQIKQSISECGETMITELINDYGIIVYERE